MNAKNSITALACVSLICGTALYIYDDTKSQQLKRDQATLEAQNPPVLPYGHALVEQIEQAKAVNPFSDLPEAKPATPIVIVETPPIAPFQFQHHDYMRDANQFLFQQKIAEQNQQAIDEMRQLRFDYETKSQQPTQIQFVP